MSIEPNNASAASRTLGWPRFGTGGCDAGYVSELRDGIDRRVDLSDHRMLLLLKTWFECGPQMPEGLRASVRGTITGFRYSTDEPGSDSMCSWTESHLLAFAVCEYLAGQTFASDGFRNDGETGESHRRHAERRLRGWLADRFHWGFSEWLSSSYYAVDVAALTLLVDYANDEELVSRAEVVLDLLLLDMALHRFDGHFVAASARSSALTARYPASSAVQVVVDAAYGRMPSEPDIEELGSIFVCRHGHPVPEALREIAVSMDTFRIHTSQGLDVAEVRETLAGDGEYPRVSGKELLPFWWSMQAFTAPQAINATMAAFRSPTLRGNEFLAQLGGVERIPRALRHLVLRTARPTSDGMAVQRGNVQTFRTPAYLLSSAQRYHPGEFGDQQHLWCACLPGGISVFGNHPAERILHTQSRPDTPRGWVGNGINPDLAQLDDVLLVQYDLRGRQGHFEGPRQLYTHIHFPFVDFDETRVGIHWVAGRRGGSFIGILATSPLDLVSESEVVQRGVRTGYAVIMADDREFGSLTSFVVQLKQYWVSLRGGVLRLETSYGVYELAWRGDFTINHEKVGHDYPRYATHVVEAARHPTVIRINGEGHRLVLDWSAGVGQESEIDATAEHPSPSH